MDKKHTRSRRGYLSIAIWATLPCAIAHGQSRFNLELLFETPTGASESIEPRVSINDDGWIAFTGRGSDGNQRVWVARNPGDVVEGSTFSSNSDRRYEGASLSNAPGARSIASSDTFRLDDSYIRRWKFDKGGSVIVASTTSMPANFDEAYPDVDVSDSGIVVFAADPRFGNTHAVMAGIDRNDSPPVTFEEGNSPYYPQISGGSRIVVRNASGSIVYFDYPSTTPTTVANLSEWTRLGSKPSISDAGDVIAFAGQQSGEAPGIFVSIPSRAQPVPVAGADTGDRVNGIDIDERVAVQSRQEGGHTRVYVIFSGTSEWGHAVYWREMLFASNGTEIVQAAATRVIGVGDSRAAFGARSLTSFDIDDPVNSLGQIGFRARLSDGATILVRATPVARAVDPSWADFERSTQNMQPWRNCCLIRNDNDPCNSSCSRGSTMRNSGCIITAFTNAIHAINAQGGRSAPPVDPLGMLAELQRTKQVDSKADVDSASLHFESTNGGFFFSAYATDRVADPSFSLVVSLLQQGTPLLLSVPSRSSSDQNTLDRLRDVGKKHVVLAYAHDSVLDPIGEDPSAVLIVDPGGYAYGNATDFARPGFVAGADDAVPIPITLADYFASLSDRPSSGHRHDTAGFWGQNPERDMKRIRDWFDEVRVFPLGGAEFVAPCAPKGVCLKRQLIRTVEGGFLERPVLPAIHMNSPVEIIVTDRRTGQRYASSDDIAQQGDVLLERWPADTIMYAFDHDDQIVDPLFPPQVLMLPEELAGADLDAEVHGVGDGDFEVSYVTRTFELNASDPIVGSISDGEVIQGSFEVSFAGAVLAIPDALNDEILLVSARSGEVVDRVSTPYAVVGAEVVLAANGDWLMSDFEADAIWQLDSQGTLLATFAQKDAIRGIAASVFGYTVGASFQGVHGWDADGNATQSRPGNFTDIALVQLGQQNLYLTADASRNRLVALDLSGNVLGATSDGSVPGPQQILRLQDGRLAVGAAGDLSIKIFTVGGQLDTSFPVSAPPVGIGQLDDGRLLVSTTSSLGVYELAGQLERTVLQQVGLGYIGPISD